MFSNERGVVLLEILVALTILSVAGLGLVELVTGNLRAVAIAVERERELADVERLLTAYTLLTRPDLDIRLGTTEIGAYVVSVQRPERELYRIAVGRVETPAVEDLVTVVFRPGENRGR